MAVNKFNVLVFGSGAREHAIADSILKSKLLNKLYLAQAGAFSDLGEVIEFSDYEDLAKKSANSGIDLAIFGPEEPLCEGIVDVFKKYNIPCIGVDKHFSQLESSKIFGKKFMEKHGIKTAEYSVIASEAKQFKKFNYPIVIKADGLCGGKGVVIANNEKFAQKTIEEFLDGKFGENSKTILVEEFLQGAEISLMSLWDGKNLLHFPVARDFKKLNKSESAPNTGGMGAFCPVKMSDFEKKKLDEYKKQLEKALKDEGADFVGFIYSGLIFAQKNNKWDWYVLEYNVRLGDPEAQAILAHLKTDFLEVLQGAIEQKLDKVRLEYNDDISACLTLACEGYPKAPRDGKKITLPDCCPPPQPYPLKGGGSYDLSGFPNQDIKIFYAGVEKRGEDMYSKGGRVLSLCTTSSDPFWDLKKYAKEIEMENKYFRIDVEVR